MPSQPENELGRELAVTELVERTIVILSREDRAPMYTAWVYLVSENFVAFLAGAVNTTFFVKRAPDDTLTDDTGKRIRVFEYLGVI